MTKVFENAIKAVYPNGKEVESMIPSAYDMGMKDMDALMKMAIVDNKCWEAIAAAFEYGFVMGNRCTHSRKLKRL